MAIALRELPGKFQGLEWGQGLAGVAVGSNNLITRTALVPGTALGKGTVPNIPPELWLSSSSSAPTYPKVLENCLFVPFFPSFHLYPALLHREREKRRLSSSQAFGNSIHVGKGSWKISLQLWKGRAGFRSNESLYSKSPLGWLQTNRHTYIFTLLHISQSLNQ